MSVSVDDRPAAVRTGESWAGLLGRIADERHVLPPRDTAPPPQSGGPRPAARARPRDTTFRRPLTATLVRVPAERQERATGYRIVTGIAGPASGAGGRAGVYLHLLPATAPGVFARVVRALDALGLPCTARVLDHPLSYGRPDSAVVHVGRELVPTVVRVAVAEGLDLRALHLNPGQPEFALGRV
jgi:hypothetical protein